MLGTRFEILGTRIGSLKRLKKTCPNPNSKPVSDFQNLLKNYCSLRQKFSNKKSRHYLSSRNNNAGSPNNDHSHREFPLDQVHCTQCWCHDLSVISGQSQIHYSSNGKMTTAGLYLWRQNTHYFSFFFRFKVHNMRCYFDGFSHKLTGCFCLEAAIGLLAVTRIE